MPQTKFIVFSDTPTPLPHFPGSVDDHDQHPGTALSLLEGDIAFANWTLPGYSSSLRRGPSLQPRWAEKNTPKLSANP